MASFLQKVQGNLYLAYRGALAHPVRMLFDRDPRPGKERFLANYAPEGNLPTSLADRAVLAGASRCIHCGLCEAYDLALAVQPRTAYDGASLLPVAYARSTPDLRHTRAVLAQLDPPQLARSEAICPTRVPLRSLAIYLKRKLAELEEETHPLPTPASGGLQPVVSPSSERALEHRLPRIGR